MSQGSTNSEDESKQKGLFGHGPQIAESSRLSGDDNINADGVEVPQDLLEISMDSLDVDATSVKNIELLLARVVGNVDRGRSELSEYAGGSPRRWRSWDPREASEISDVDAVELHRWAVDPTPSAWPRAQQRMRRDRGGQLVVLRDVSMSMAGVHSTWSARVTLGLLEAARERKMRFGYVEFNHRSRKHFHPDGTFFSDDYGAIVDVAMRMKCSGWTNYEQPLSDALNEFAAMAPSRTGGHGKQQRHVLLITDGVPTHGDPLAQRQIMRAKELGVVIHSVYLGWPQTLPSALQAISTNTNGALFAAFYQPDPKEHTGSTFGPREPRIRAPVGVGLDSGHICVVEM